MPSESLEGWLAQLEQLKTCFGPGDGARVEELLAALEQAQFPDAGSLARLHEALLFLRAHPHSAEIVRRTERILEGFAGRVARLREAGVDLSALEEPEISGIAGTAFSAIFSYPVVSHLARRHAASLEIDWEGYEETDRMGASLPPCMPLLEEDALVEANVPYWKWLEAARGPRQSGLAWLVGSMSNRAGTLDEQARIYDSLRVPVRWELGESPATRTRARVPGREFFFQQTPLVRRSEVSLEAALAAPPLPLGRVPRARAEALLDLLPEVSAARHREVYGYTYGDPGSMLRAEAGRGVEIFLLGLPPRRRLPLRAYHVGPIVKNGVPVGYLETLSLFERAEVGYNVYYTFREGESAWLYGRVLRLLNQVLGVTCFSVDPYQIGHHNEEAIQAGSFWFYRKLGFRAVETGAARLAEREAEKIRARPGYRTPARVLQRLAESPMIFEPSGAEAGAWDRFQARNLGLRAARSIVERHGGDATRTRKAALHRTAAALDVILRRWNEDERRAFSQLALILTLIPDLRQWRPSERRAVAAIIRAKAARDETRYLRLLQRNARVRAAVLRLGS